MSADDHLPHGGGRDRKGKTMTTVTTGTTGPQAWKIALVAGAVGLATLVVVNLPQTTSDTTDQQVAAAATLPESATGFEYDNESTSGQVASSGVTAQYLGNSGELFPYENGPAPQAAPQITQEFLDGPSSGAQRVDPRAAVAAGLSPGAIDAVVAGTTQVAPSAPLAEFDVAPYVAYAEGMRETAASEAADWEGLGGPYEDGTVADYYTQGIAQRTPQQNVSMR